MYRNVLIGLGTAGGVTALFFYPTSLNHNTTSTTSNTATGSNGGSDDAAGVSKTYTGDAVMTRWGIVQVAITVRGGRIVSAKTLQHPDTNRRDIEINDYAVPILNHEAVAANSASIDAVSGATVTSDGYIASLQSAIDQAHL